MSTRFPFAEGLPIAAVLPDVLASLEDAPNLVLVAPPGAGKTTTLPLALLEAPWRGDGTIVVLEPRRIATRAAAARMAQLRGGAVGAEVGYRMRFDAKTGPDTRVEVVTQGVFARRLAAEPDLPGVAAVLFDEFHERSLDTDMALALCLDLQEGLRPDLRLVAMSATLDGAGVAALMDAPLIESEGRAHPVELLHDPPAPRTRPEAAVEAGVTRMLAETEGDILAFLPGRAQVERAAGAIARRHGGVSVHALHGGTDGKAQAAALAPDGRGRRKVVVATAVAETSLTIDGVRVVVDSGLARAPVYEPGTGLTRLATVKASRAAVDQRTGRAGRQGPGTCLRLWHPGQTAALPARDVPEIAATDLARFALDLAEWGVRQPSALRLPDQPPPAAWQEACALLERLGFRDGEGAITPAGRRAHALPLHPRLAAMVLVMEPRGRAAVRQALLLAFLLQDGELREPDLEERLRRAPERWRRQADAWTRRMRSRGGANGPAPSAGAMLAHAFPDRIARRGATIDGVTRYRLSNGRGGRIEADHALAGHEWLVVADMAGAAGAARITAAAAIDPDELPKALMGDETRTFFDVATGTVRAEAVRMLGSLELGRPRAVKVAAKERTARFLQAIEEHGMDALRAGDGFGALQARLLFLHRHEASDRPVDDAALASDPSWIEPWVAGVESLHGLRDETLCEALLLHAGMDRSRLDRLAPARFQTPAGTREPLRYDADGVTLAVRPQLLFGLDRHPCVLEGRVPVRLELVSPAGRPIQVTTDLPAFWRGSWADVRGEMRGRYPRHPWPEDPLAEAPTGRAKPRGGARR